MASALSAAGAAEETTPPRAIRPSDVVFMYDNPKMYEPYGCTVLGWAGGGSRERIEQAHAKGVRLFSVSVGFRTEFGRMIDFSPEFLDAACRNFAGEPFIVPWLWDHKHKGQPAWWFCTNSPLYRKYLESRLVEMMKAQPDGLHIDDYTGTAGAVTWQSACFCRNCLAGFREYLAAKAPKEKLAELGIKDLATFDYRQFLLDKGVKPEEYNKRRRSLPLAAEFHDFQVKANNAHVAAYRKRAEELRGKPLTLCVNSWINSPESLVIARQLSYVCCEMEHQAASRAVPLHPIYIYKMADGLGLPVASTASGPDWAYVKEHKLPGLVRTWIALSYAYGHNFMAPHRQWCYAKEKGTHWYDGPTEEYAWLYHFVRRNAAVLDGHEAVAPVAVVYDNAARRQGKGNIEPICTALAEKNVPFTVVVAGDDWLDYRLDAAKLAKFKAVIVSKDLALDEPQRKLIEQVKQQGRLVVWPDWAALEKLVPAPVVIEGANDVLAVVRAAPGGGVAVHLVNRRYDGQKDAMIAQKDITLRVRHDLVDLRKLPRARWRTACPPHGDIVELETTSDDQYTTVKIPELRLWGIVEFFVGLVES
jgi:hypothetical protein